MAARGQIVLISVLLIFLLAEPSVPLAAPEDALYRRVSVNFARVSMKSALDQLGASTGLRFEYPEGLLDHLDSVLYQATDTEAGRILTRILRPRGLRIERREGDRIIIGRLDPLDEFRVKREEIYEFDEKPAIAVQGDKVTIRFATKGWCDVTVAIEDEDGRIVRHLASGVLGENAPEPFLWNTKKQVLVWDGKADKGEYVEDRDRCTIRISLGLKPALERPLFWSPYKRVGEYPPIICAAPDGVYVFEGRCVDSLRLYDHDGNYVRTIYPFPAAKLSGILGLERQTVVQTGESLPRKLGYQQATLLTSGTSVIVSDNTAHGDGFGATAMAVMGDRIALAFMRLNRLKTDGSTGGLPLTGPVTGFIIPRGTFSYIGTDQELGPTSAAFNPDGKTLYLTGYVAKHGIYGGGGYCRHGVYKLDFEKDHPPQLFAGDMDPKEDGTDEKHFAVPTAVACDARGRVYVADFVNDRIQVFAPTGEHLKTIPCRRPAKVQIHPQTQEIYVYSWHIVAGLANELCHRRGLKEEELRKIVPTLTRFAPFDDPRQLEQLPLPLPPPGANQYMMGALYQVELDFWAREPTLWVVGRKRSVTRDEVGAWGVGAIGSIGSDEWATAGIVLYVRQDEKWEVRRHFGEEARKTVTRVKPPDLGIQRLAVNEKNHKLYVLEHISFSKCHHTLLEIDPETGKTRTIPLPFGTEDVCFDSEGHIYLRTDLEVVRYDPQTWREVPWDYGEERERVTFGGPTPAARVQSALPLPGGRPMWFHLYGMAVSPRGHIAVTCVNRGEAPARNEPGTWKGVYAGENIMKYEPVLYPGRMRHQEIHIWDRHGRLVREDAVPGLAMINGIGLDGDDNVYAMYDGARYLGDRPYPNRQAGALVKFRARGSEWGTVRVTSSSRNTSKRYVPFVRLPLSPDQYPRRPPDITSGVRNSGDVWMTGAEWFYGGVGIMGAGCNCWHTRFCLDNFARSFAPEPDLFSVAVLDAAGNLIVRVGRYGNADDGVPLVKEGRLPSLNRLGGDEVALFYPAYVGVDTDRRLFIADVGNARIVSVRLGYHTEERIKLKEKGDGMNEGLSGGYTSSV
ncbi:MAG: hypothetical protein ACUVWX_13770, partial [Kiritimatiellia bacterium]